jgi:hypothetical protein
VALLVQQRGRDGAVDPARHRDQDPAHRAAASATSTAASVAASVGSACTTGSVEPSHVLTAMGYPDDEARGSLRLSLGRTTTEAEIDEALDVVPRVVEASRAGASVLAADPLGQAVAS